MDVDGVMEPGFAAIWNGTHRHSAECGQLIGHSDRAYPLRDLEIAIRQVALRSPVKSAAKMCNVPSSTLRNYVDPERSLYGRTPGAHHFDRVLDDEQEKSFLHRWCVLRSFACA